MPLLTVLAPSLVLTMVRDCHELRGRDSDHLPDAGQADPSQAHLAPGHLSTRCSTIWVGCAARGLPRLDCASRFLRAFFGPPCGLFLFALTNEGGGVLSRSRSSMRAWATRNCSLTSLSCLFTSLSCSRACLSRASKVAMLSSSFLSRVYQKRSNVNGIRRSP
jgi:hypothetical protein